MKNIKSEGLEKIIKQIGKYKPKAPYKQPTNKPTKKQLNTKYKYNPNTGAIEEVK